MCIRDRKDSAQGRAGSYHPGAHHREGEADAHYIEVQPKLTYNGWGISYYFEGEYAIENDAEYHFQQVRPVSYTHLDVYKRQGYGRWLEKLMILKALLLF